MLSKNLVVFTLLLAATPAQLPVYGQTSPASHPAAASSTPSVPGPASAATPSAAGSAARTDCEGGTCDYSPPHITVATAAPAPAPWPLQDRIAWGANILLALLGYAGIMMALSYLKKAERQARYVEVAANAAADSAQAALALAQGIFNAERPWILVTVTPSPSIENGFTVIATNRGRSPARLVGISNETRFAVNEAQMPGIPEFKPEDPEMPPVSIILLPGEFTSLKSFSRDDVKGLCETEEKLRRIENWEERIFLYGKVIYKDLMTPMDAAPHESSWCCRYIHGRQKSGLVMAGTQEYNMHT